MAIVDFDTAKEHLRITHNTLDAEILTKLEHASAIVVDYLKKPVGTWELGDVSQHSSGDSGENAPYPVEAATLLVLGALMEGREGEDQILTQAVKDLLHRYRDPALA